MGTRNAFKLAAQEIRETDIIKACKDVLALRGWKAFRLQCGLLRSPDLKRWIPGEPKGTPDYIVAHERYPAFLLETKRPGGKLSDAQEFRVLEIQQGYRLAFHKADTARSLTEFLNQHERKYSRAP